MLRLRQILRYFTQGTSKKQISEITGVARNTVKRYIGRFITLKITYEDIMALTDRELECFYIFFDQERTRAGKSNYMNFKTLGHKRLG